jgi:hypothetical protein
MPQDYEIQIDIAISKIRDALLNDPTFIQQVTDLSRTTALRAARSTGNVHGNSAGTNTSSRGSSG